MDSSRAKFPTQSRISLFIFSTDHTVKGKNLKIKYGTQVHHSPPIFAFYTNHPELYPVAYKRYLENQLREHFDLKGVSFIISFRKK